MRALWTGATCDAAGGLSQATALKLDCCKMKKTLNFYSIIGLLIAFCWNGTWAQGCGAEEYQNVKGHCVPCEGCPPGEEPDRKCGSGAGLGMVCKPCPAGSFSPGFGLDFCWPHSHCESKKRVQVSPGTAAVDTLCGDCMPGYYSPEGETNPSATCRPCSSAHRGVPGCPGSKKWLTRLARNAESVQRREEKMPGNGTRDGKAEESATQYAVLAIVPVFCVMGLLGILFCNLLMKRGYHCTANKDADEEGAKSERNGSNNAYRIEDANEDTIGVLVRLITEKKENAAVLEEMLKDYHSKQIAQPIYKPINKLHLLPQLPHICRHQHHLHTVQGLATRSGPSCTRCSQKKWPEVLPSTEAGAEAALTSNGTATKLVKPGSKAGRPGEITILSVGRFRVARIPEQKPNPPEVKSISESVGEGPTEQLYACLAPEQKPLVGSGGKPRWLTTEDGQQEVII
ncbi:tumor necrosis factor receptor superfamily member 19L isoform X1 [Anolis carolinensis]|uniref:tumor necrosis factor receptor superfamily member 19L isoform X1 n=2 Tax=Anolis carolinensis TaxID=28377 RepID=UPI002F2B684D